MKTRLLSISSLLMLGFFSCHQQPAVQLTEIALIPYPQTIQSSNAKHPLVSEIALSFSEPKLKSLADIIITEWQQTTAVKIIQSENQATIHLNLNPDQSWEHTEAYELAIEQKKIKLSSGSIEGLYRAWQTFRQLLLLAPQSNGSIYIPTGNISDSPTLAYRGVMLDVSRHFFSVSEVKRFIDQLALYKINYLHLHLSDDQGWRIEIKSWPYLTEIGGRTEVGGAVGGFYTQKDYQELVRYAQNRHITIVPEIDMPGHTNAALASYPELNCNNKAPDLYTGTEVGFSSLCVEKPITYQFVDDVVREIAALTPGPYFHIGGDESHATSESDYITFINRIIPIVKRYNKHILGWDEIQLASISSSTTVQYWANRDNAVSGIKKGAQVLMSPAQYAYLDMKYDSLSPLGLDWAGLVSVQKAYNWNPAKLVDGISPENILGIEAPLWTETITNSSDIEYMTFPRLPGYAEIGWTVDSLRQWETYKKRLAAHQKIFNKYQINFYPAPEIPWD